MRKNVMKLWMTALLFVAAVPFVNAQVKVGDVLCEGDRLVSLANYDSSSSTAIGVVFYVDATGQHGWAVSLDNVDKCSWGVYDEDTSLGNVVGMGEAIKNIDGYANTKAILDNGSDCPAFTVVDFENGWYLPAIGQLKRLFDHLNKVNEALEKTGGTLLELNGYTYWSSTECSSKDAWYMCTIGGIGRTSNSLNDCKTSHRLIRSVKTF